MRRSNKELWLAFLAAFIVTGVYAFVITSTRQVPAASSLFGHLIGILGVLLMLVTETLYSYRKRSRRARWGFHGRLVAISHLHRSAWALHGAAAYLLEIQRTGRGDHAPDCFNCRQRFHRPVYLHAHPAHTGRSRNHQPPGTG